MSSSWRLRIYVGAVVLGALGALIALPSHGTLDHPWTLLLLVAITGVAGSRPVRISTMRVQLTVTHPFIFCALGALGPIATVVVSVSGVLGAMTVKRPAPRPIRIAFNLGAQALSAAAAVAAFYALGGRAGDPLVQIMLPLAGATAAFFLVNTGLVSIAVALEKGEKIFDVWKNSFLWTVVSYLTGLTVAAMMLVVQQQLGPWGLALSIPPCWMLLAFYKSNKGRLEEHQRRITEVETLNLELEHKVAERTRELEDALLRIEEKNRDLRDANVQLEKASRAKSEFLANVSHELRTPLNAVIGFSELLDDSSVGPLNDRQRELLGDIRGSGEHLFTLINDILDLSKVEAAKMEIHKIPVDVGQLVRNSVTMVRTQAAKKNIELEASCSEDIHLALLDPGMFRSILVNLLSNAVKFTPQDGRIDVAARIEDSDLLLEVRDTGIGISEEDQRRVFQQFYQVDGSYTREYQGTGLGLALVNRMVEMHHGTVTLESAVGEGSRFLCTFPACLIDCEEPLPAPREVADTEPGVETLEDFARSASGDGRSGPSVLESGEHSIALPAQKSAGRTVLLVEDNLLSRKLARNALRTKGYQVVEATSGEEALERVRDQRPDLILMDLKLPGGIDGLEATRRLKRDPSTAAITVVALTAHPEDVGEQRATEAGCSGYITKPIQLSRFPEQIESYLTPKESVA